MRVKCREGSSSANTAGTDWPGPRSAPPTCRSSTAPAGPSTEATSSSSSPTAGSPSRAIEFARNQRLHLVNRTVLAEWAGGSTALWELLRAVPPPRRPTPLSLKRRSERAGLTRTDEAERPWKRRDPRWTAGVWQADGARRERVSERHRCTVRAAMRPVLASRRRRRERPCGFDRAAYRRRRGRNRSIPPPFADPIDSARRPASTGRRSNRTPLGPSLRFRHLAGHTNATPRTPALALALALAAAVHDPDRNPLTPVWARRLPTTTTAGIPRTFGTPAFLARLFGLPSEGIQTGSRKLVRWLSNPSLKSAANAFTLRGQ